MFYRDLERAGIERETPSGIIDLHSLRHTFVTNIVASGATVKTAQELARHSTPTLTFNVYAHARLHDVASAVERLPDPFSSQHPKPLAATGTDPLTRPRDHLAAQGQRARDGNVRFVSDSDMMTESIDHVKMVRNPNEGGVLR